MRKHIAVYAKNTCESFRLASVFLYVSPRVLLMHIMVTLDDSFGETLYLPPTGSTRNGGEQGAH